MSSLRPGEVVCPLVALFGAVFGRKWLPAKEWKTGDIDGNVLPSRQLGESIVQTAAGKLEAELVKQTVPDGGRVLSDGGKIASLLHGAARPCVLTEILILRVYFDPR